MGVDDAGGDFFLEDDATGGASFSLPLFEILGTSRTGSGTGGWGCGIGGSATLGTFSLLFFDAPTPFLVGGGAEACAHVRCHAILDQGIPGNILALCSSM